MGATFDGLLVLLIAGITNGSFTLPMKFTKKWEWENTWLVYTFFALFLFPPLLAVLTVPGLSSVYANAPGASTAIGIGVVCGAAWGIGQVFFGLAVEGVGIALAFSIILGLSAALGSLLPLLRENPGEIFQPVGLAILGGVALVLVGVAIMAVAGRKREKALGVAAAGTVVTGEAAAAAAAPAPKVSVAMGLIYCTISGVGSALQNFGFSEGHGMQAYAQAHGVAAVWTPSLVWMPIMLAGGIPGLIYCSYLVKKRKSGNRFSLPGTGGYWLLAAIMAVFWFGSTTLYGIGAGILGSLGTVLGWPVFMSLIVIVASILGLLTGEWKGAGKTPVRIMYSGIAVLILAIVVLSRA